MRFPLRVVYLIRNLTRNPLRAVLTCVAVAFPVVVCVLSVAVIQELEAYLDNSAKQLRLAVTHKASIIHPLPSGHRAKIESLDPTRQRLTSVCAFRWIGGRVENDPRLLSTLSADADTYVETFPEENLTDEEAAAWQRNRQAIVLGRATAEQFGWKKGDRITIQASVPPYAHLVFDVVSTGENAVDVLTNWCRRDYIEEEMKHPGVESDWISFFFVKCASQADLEHYRAAIDELFAHSLDETKTQDEKTFMNEFITQQFNLPRNLTILAAVTIFVAVMAAANTMSMNFRDRMNELATLKAMGFGGRMLFGLTQFESMALCLIGGLIGSGLPYVIFNHTPMKEVTLPVIQALEIRASVCAQALLISVAIGFLAALWPSWQAVRMHVVTALRNLE